MRYLLLLSALFMFTLSQAQEDTTAPYWKTRAYPKLDLIKIDSSHFTNQSLKKNQNTLIMFFSPTCDHCRHQMADLLLDIDKFKNIQIVMASYQPMEDIVKFYQEFQLGSVPNITIGRDSRFLIVPYFKVRSLPYLALYDTKGKLITGFEGNRKTDIILNAFKQN